MAADPWFYEKAARQRGFSRIGGIDEAGRGPIAGPVVAACVVLPFGRDMPLVRDSKQMTPRQRELAAALIEQCAEAIGVGSAPPERIDERNILQATHEAMREAAGCCAEQVDFALIDGLPVPHFPLPHQAVVKGDSRSVSIGAASIIAKVTRDRLMRDLDSAYPGYGFALHKGYPSSLHLQRLAELGPCPAHRKSFGPVRSALERARGASEPPTLDLGDLTGADAGLAGEAEARCHLESEGMLVLATRYRRLEGEVDIIAQDGDEIVFVEVKCMAQARQIGGRSSVDARKRRRLVLAAEAFLQERGLPERPCRFDVVEVSLDRAGRFTVCLIRGAFLAGE